MPRLKTDPSCPNCKNLLTGYGSPDGEANPAPGNLTVCSYCNTVLQFTKDMMLKRASTSAIEDTSLLSLSKAQNAAKEWRENTSLVYGAILKAFINEHGKQVFYFEDLKDWVYKNTGVDDPELTNGILNMDGITELSDSAYQSHFIPESINSETHKKVKHIIQSRKIK